MIDKVIPNFLLVGATKAATTWLYQRLNEHPEIYVPSLKEVNYFSRRYDRPQEWYLSFFTDVKEEKAIGELSPSYFTSAEAPSRIKAFNPNMRLIFMLRNPIQRVYSHYCMELRYNTVSEDIEQELNLDSIIVRESLYYQQITKYLELFPRENLKFIIYDDIKTNPQKVLVDLYNFLQVDPNYMNSAIHEQTYIKQPRQKFEKIYTLLVAIYRWINNNNEWGRRILSTLKDRGFNDKFHDLNSTEKSYPQISPTKKEQLKEFYQTDIKQLAQFLERDLSSWLSPNQDPLSIEQTTADN